MGLQILLFLLILISAVYGFSFVGPAAQILESLSHFQDLEPSTFLDSSTLHTSLSADGAYSTTAAAAKSVGQIANAAQGYLKSNPNSYLPTSTVVSEWLSKNVDPFTKGFGEVWKNSPLKRDTDSYFSQSTSAATSQFFGYINDRAGPNLAPISKLEADWGEKIWAKFSGDFERTLDSCPDLRLTTGQYFANIFGGLSESVAEPVPGLPSLPSISFDSVAAGAAPKIDAINLAAIQETVVTATTRATSTFNAQLAEQAAVLQQNTASGLESTGKVITIISDDFSKNLPRVIDVATKAPDSIAAGLNAKIEQFNKDLPTVVAGSDRNIFTSSAQKFSSWSESVKSYQPPTNIINTEKVAADFARGTADLSKKLQELPPLEIDASLFQEQASGVIKSLSGK